MKYLSAFRDIRIIATLGVVIAFLAPGPSKELSKLLVPALVVIMTLSLKNTPLPRFDRDNFKEAFMLLAMNFLVLTPILIIGSFFMSDPYTRIGLIIYALMPPAISVISLSFILHADLNHAVFAEIAGYIFAFVFTPVMVYLFFSEIVDIFPLFKLLLLLMIFPLLASRFLRNIEYDFREIVNVMLGFAIYIGVALNVDRILTNPWLVGEILILFLITKIAFGLIIYYIGKRKGLPLRETALFTLFGTMKNAGMALGILIALFDPRTILPLAVASLFYPILTIFIESLFDGERKLLKGLKKHKA